MFISIARKIIEKSMGLETARRRHAGVIAWLRRIVPFSQRAHRAKSLNLSVFTACHTVSCVCHEPARESIAEMGGPPRVELVKEVHARKAIGERNS